VTPSSGTEAPLDVVVHRAKEGIKGGKKRRSQNPQESTTDHDDDNDGEASGSSVRRISITVHIDKRQTRLPTDHFKRFLEEACPNHASHQAQAQRL
jgi:hypothetical protein